MHRGSTPKSKAAAAERETMAEAAAVLRKLHIEPVANPVEALLQPSFSTATAR